MICLLEAQPSLRRRELSNASEGGDRRSAACGRAVATARLEDGRHVLRGGQGLSLTASQAEPTTDEPAARAPLQALRNSCAETHPRVRHWSSKRVLRAGWPDHPRHPTPTRPVGPGGFFIRLAKARDQSAFASLTAAGLEAQASGQQHLHGFREARQLDVRYRTKPTVDELAVRRCSTPAKRKPVCAGRVFRAWSSVGTA